MSGYQGFAPQNLTRPATGQVPTFARGTTPEKDSVAWATPTPVPPIPGPTTAAVTYVFYNPQTTVPLADQTGSFAYPYASLATAVAACGATGGQLICMGLGDAAQGFTFDGDGINNQLNIVSFNGPNSRAPFAMGNIVLQNHCHVTMQGISMVTTTLTNSRLWADYCNFGSIDTNASNLRARTFQAATPGDTSTPWVVGGNMNFDQGSTFAFFGYKLAGNILLQFTGGAATTENCIQQCDMAGGPGFSIFAPVGQTIYIDQFSVARARAQNFNLGLPNNNSGFTILDLPVTTGVVFAVGALAAAFADVTVALPGARVGDVFEVTTTTRLANVGIVDAFAPASNQITLRFFGTTAGGNVTCNIVTKANSGN